jgi:phosphotransferase system enzyme I (PtsP)
MNDFDDLSRRLMKQLIGNSGQPLTDEDKFIVVARTMGAAELLDYDQEHIRGLVLEEATATSHVVIVARALGIPVVSQVHGFVARAENGDLLIVDGDDGSAHLRPVEDLTANYEERIAFRAEREARFDALRDKSATTLDGVDINLLLNAGLTMDLPQLDHTGAVGIGLFRTELQFMISSRLPRMNEQERFYKSVLEAANGRPVTFRTVDIGGDKVLPYLRSAKEDNPALGWRAIRLSIDRPGLLRMQLRALLKAAIGHTLKIKLPMITTVTEIDQVRVMLDHEIEAQARFGHALPNEILLGSMIEVPQLLFQLDELMAKVDFVSVGSNDLFQFMAASDRTNAYLANRYTPLSRPFLRALREIVRAAERHNTPLQLCGELAGDRLSALALLGLGYRSISMPPASVGPIKEMIRSIDMAKISHMVNAAVDEPIGARTMRETLSDYADQHGIAV